MKRHRAVSTILAAVLLACATNARAADGALRLNAGVTRSSLFDASGWSNGLGYRVGASVTVPLVAGVWFEPEIAWSRRTTVAAGRTDQGTVTSRIALQYLEAPMLVKRAFFRQRRLAPLVLGGVYYAANVTAHGRTQFASNTFDENIRSEVKRHDAGWIAGGGVEFRQAGRTWTAEVRYLRGLTHLYATNEISRWRTRSLTTTLGMKW